MPRFRPRKYVLVTLGLALLAFTAVVSGGTERACEIESVVHETIGIHPSESTILGVDFERAEIEWYDGCNRRSGPLVTFVLGLASAGLGLSLLGRDL